MSFNPTPIFKLKKRLHFTQTSYGSARLMTEKEAVSLRLTEQGYGKVFCPYVGIIPKENIDDMYPYFLLARKPSYLPSNEAPELQEGNGHLLTIAPTRAGKGTG